MKKAMTNVNRMLSSERSLKIETNLSMEGKASSANLDTNHRNKLFFPQHEIGPISTIYKGHVTPVAARSDMPQ